MSKKSDNIRVIELLEQSGTGLSHRQVKESLALSDARYEVVKKDLFAQGNLEPYVCRGGGIKLKQGVKNVTQSTSNLKSSVPNEAALYEPLCRFLSAQDKDEEIDSVICDTSKSRVRGKWQNPDATRIAIETFKFLHKTTVHVTTYELKQFPRWDLNTVFEAASHHRFAHESQVILEWPSSEPFSLTDPRFRINEIARECQRFGVGLATMQLVDGSFRLFQKLEARPTQPLDEDVEDWLSNVFDKDAVALKSFNLLMVQQQLK